MLSWRNLINYTIIKGQREMRVLIYFPTENNLLSLFTRIWIETHFPLLRHVAYQNKELSSANNLLLDDNSSAKSFMYIKKDSGPSIKPCGTPALILVHVKTCPFKTTFYFLFLEKSYN